jgi:hypothetical protein
MEKHDQELTSVGAQVAQDPIEADSDLKKMEKIRLARIMLRIGLGAEWAPPGSFMRGYLHKLDTTIRNADTQSAKARKARRP